MAGADGFALARPATGVGQLAYGALSLPALDAGRRVGQSFQGLVHRSRLRVRAGRCHDLQGSCGCDLSKRGLEARAIGRSRGGLTTKIHAVVDALGLPVRFEITPGQSADSPQAEGLIEGLHGVGNVIADSGYDTEALRRFIIETLGAEAHIKRNLSRARCCPIDWVLYKERHLVECFFNRIKRFRRIALRVEKTLTAFRAFVSIACAMTWLA